MIEVGLDISLQGGYLLIGTRRQPLKFENYFYLNTWSAQDTPFVLDTKQEVRRNHRFSIHPVSPSILGVLLLPFWGRSGLLQEYGGQRM